MERGGREGVGAALRARRDPGDDHGGDARARQEAERDWMYVAPESVGDEQAVLDAGCWALSSEHAIIQIQEQRPGQWQAFLGIGSHMIQVPRPDAPPCEARKRVRGRCRFDSEETAIEAGITAWRAHLDRTVEEIRAARGGTLEWGLPVAPRSDPIVRVGRRSGERTISWSVHIQGVTYLGQTAEQATERASALVEPEVERRRRHVTAEHVAHVRAYAATLRRPDARKRYEEDAQKLAAWVVDPYHGLRPTPIKEAVWEWRERDIAAPGGWRPIKSASG